MEYRRFQIIGGYRAFAIERGKTVRKNKIYFYMPNMFFRLRYVQIWH